MAYNRRMRAAVSVYSGLRIMKSPALVLFFTLVAGCTQPVDQSQADGPSTAPSDLAAQDGGMSMDAAPPDLVDPGPPPELSTMDPTAGDWDTKVTLTGAHLSGITQVTYGGASASFTVLGDGTLEATVPIGVGSRPFVVSGPAGSATTAATFHIPTKVSSYYPTMDIYAANPFFVYGYSFTGTTVVEIGATPVTSFTVVSDEQLSVQIDPTTQSAFQTVTVVAPGGSATSSTTFFVRCTRDEQCPGSYCVNGTHACN